MDRYLAVFGSLSQADHDFSLFDVYVLSVYMEEFALPYACCVKQLKDESVSESGQGLDVRGVVMLVTICRIATFCHGPESA